MIYKYDFAFIGGDMRQIYMINDLINQGYSVIVYGLHDPLLDNRCVNGTTLIEVALSSKIVITPIPISKDGIHVLSKSNCLINLDEFISLLTSDHRIFGGCFSKAMLEHFTSNQIDYHDFMEQEELTLYNSIATAEGVIAEAITSSKINLHASKVLVMGYGRCAITLATKLKYLCGSVDITARSSEQLAKAYTASHHVIPLNELSNHIHEYDFIFNTIPSMVLTKDLLNKTKSHVIIIDIASNPGGVDFTYAKEIGRYTNLYLGIPGKVSPKSSASFLKNHLLNQLRKK